MRRACGSSTSLLTRSSPLGSASDGGRLSHSSYVDESRLARSFSREASAVLPAASSAVPSTKWASPSAGFRRTASCWERRCWRSEEHTSELQSRQYLVCRLLLEKKKYIKQY